ncbi:MAG: 4a-hydroxytetrahydrobiopterin dehydratase [Acidobacteriota bacterium]
MERKKLSDEEIEKALNELDRWKVKSKNLRKRFEFKNFSEALNFVNKVGTVAEKKDHHPDINFGWGYAEFFITTHDSGGLTHNDFELAKAIEKL